MGKPVKWTPDKKQVMFDIERCICHVPDACRDCSKYKGVDGLRCMEELMVDAYALLKEQEAVEPKKESDDYPGSWWYVCGNCGEVIDWHDMYCRHCGRVVKWNELAR